MQTLRRELRQVTKTLLTKHINNILHHAAEGMVDSALDYAADDIVDAVLKIRGIAKMEDQIKGTDWMILGGVSSEDIASVIHEEVVAKEKLDHYEREMVYNPLPWTDKKLERLARFLKKQSLEDIHRFAVWSKREYSSFSPAKARQFPEQVIELWPQACPKEVERPIPAPKPVEPEPKYIVDLEKFTRELKAKKEVK